MNKSQYTKWEVYFVLLIPIIHVVAELTARLFEHTSLNPGNIRAIIFLIFILFYAKKYLLNTIENIYLIVFLIYLFILSFLSSDITYTFYIYIKLFISTLMFSIGYYYVSVPSIYAKFNKSLYIALGIVVIGTFISMYFNVGKTAYGDEETTFGASGPNISKIITVLVLILIHAYFSKTIIIKNNILFFSIIVIGSFLVLLTVKRTAVASLIIGFFAYLFLIPKTLKLFKYLSVLVVISTLLSPFYLPKIEERFAYREDEMSVEHFQEEDIKEWRVIETEIAINAFNEKNLAYKLFGFELFNGQSYFKMKYMFHNDFANLLAGSGIIGILIYALFYLSIIFKLFLYSNIKFSITQYYKGIIYTMFIIVVFFSISGQIPNIGVRLLIMMYLGATMAQLKYYKQNESFY